MDLEAWQFRAHIALIIVVAVVALLAIVKLGP